MKNRNKSNIAQLKPDTTNKLTLQYLQTNYQTLKKSIAVKQNTTKIDVHQLFKLMNVIAMTYAQNLSLQQAFDWLYRSKKHIAQDLHMKLIYFNNLACLYHRNQNFDMALCELKKAQDLVDQIETQQAVSAKTKIQTFLNFSAVFSSLNNHIKSLSFIKNALQLLQNQQYYHQQYEQLWVACKHNEAVQYEHLKLVQDSIESYTALQTYLRTTNNKFKYESMIKNIQITIKKLKNRVKYQNLKFGFNNRQNILKRLTKKKNCQFYINVAQIQNALKQRKQKPPTSQTIRTLSVTTKARSTHYNSVRSQKLSERKLNIKMIQNDQLNHKCKKVVNENITNNKIQFKSRNMILNKKKTSSLLPEMNTIEQQMQSYFDRNYASVKQNCQEKQNFYFYDAIKVNKNKEGSNRRITNKKVLGIIN